MRLIDADAIEWYGCDFEDYECEHKECKDCRHANCYKPQVDEIQTVQAVPIEVLKEIRQEIDKWHHLTDKAFNDGIDTALEIIDKHIKEIEDEEN